MKVAMANFDRRSKLPEWVYRIFKTEFIYFQLLLPDYLFEIRMKEINAAIKSVCKFDMLIEDYMVFDKMVMVSGICDEKTLAAQLFKEFTDSNPKFLEPGNLIEVSVTDFINCLSNFGPNIKSKRFYVSVAYIYDEWLYVWEGLEISHDYWIRSQEGYLEQRYGFMVEDHQFLSVMSHCTAEQFELEKIEFRKRLEDTYNQVHKEEELEFDDLNEVDDFEDLFVNLEAELSDD